MEDLDRPARLVHHVGHHEVLQLRPPRGVHLVRGRGRARGWARDRVRVRVRVRVRARARARVRARARDRVGDLGIGFR